MKVDWPAPTPKPARTIAQAFAAGVIALVVLFPRPTQAEAVEEADRIGDYEEDGMRFGAIVISGSLELSANAPGGWALVRTYENKSSDPAQVTLEERVTSTESMDNARVEGREEIVLARVQTIKLGPNEKKKVGTYLPAALAEGMTKAHRTRTWAANQRMLGGSDGEVTFKRYAVTYLRALGPGQTAAVHKEEGREWQRPARMPDLREVPL